MSLRRPAAQVYFAGTSQRIPKLQSNSWIGEVGDGVIAGQRRELQATVLVADDSPANLDLILACLQVEGLHIVTARDGQEALRQAEQARPDLILLDVMMPQLSGFEVCKRLKQIESVRDAPVIFLTALTDADDKIRGFEAGGVDFVTKPIGLHELRARVTVHLRLHAMQMQLIARNAELERYRKGLEQLVADRTAELNERNRQLGAEVRERKRLQRAALAAAGEEQRRLARELHDGLGQDLVGLGMLLDGATRAMKAARPPTIAELERLSMVVRNALGACHDIAHGLSPLTNTAGGLLEALNALRVRLSGPPGPVIEIDAERDCCIALSGEVCDHVYRIVQEAATNAVKHANAQHVRVRLSIEGGRFRIQVADDGRGFLEPDSTRKGLGLHTMRDRAASVGGTLHISANSGGGTTVLCEVPATGDQPPADRLLPA